MLDIESLAVDPVAAEEGTWASYLGAKFLIARHNSDKATFLRSKLTLERWDEITGEDAEVAGEAARQINAKVMAEAVLLDWEGVTKDGGEITYTPEVGYQYLVDPRFRDLVQYIENFSLNRANYRERVEAEVAESVKDSAAS
ncbi:hypothetical protein D9M70_514600 [compost metagenome]